MARYVWLKCSACKEEVEVYNDGDNPLLCPECLSVDEFVEIDEEE